MTNVFYDMETFLQDWDEAHSISSVLHSFISWLKHTQKAKEFNPLNVLWKVHEHTNLRPHLHTNTPLHTAPHLDTGKLNSFDSYTVEFW